MNNFHLFWRGNKRLVFEEKCSVTALTVKTSDQNSEKLYNYANGEEKYKFSLFQMALGNT